MPKFYRLGFAPQPDEALIKVVGPYDEQALFRGACTVGPVRTRLDEGRRLLHVVRFQDPFNFGVSKWLLSSLNRAALSGWRTYELEIEGTMQRYAGFQITGRCGPIERPESPGFVVGMSFAASTWDGSDFFLPDTTLMTICTERARGLIEKCGVENLRIEEIEKVQWYSA